jgi:hypothetical protein
MRAALVVWLLLSIALLIAYAPAIATLTTTDPDDALRLVQVRDLIGGQAWWDVSQHRINPAGGGGLMHWSRIVDTPLALGIAGLSPLLGAAMAERVVMALWPLLLLGAAMLVLARMAATLGDRRIALLAPLLLASDFVILYQFTPLRIDHHGWQILLTLCALAVLMRPADAKSGALAGIAAAALLAISLEGLPAVALFAALIAIEWLWTGAATARQRLNAFLWTLCGTAIALQFVTRGPDALVQRWCDALSLPYLGSLAVAALCVTLGAWSTDRFGGRRIGRALMLAGAGAASGAILIAIEPLCMKGPFGTLDPLVQIYWYVHVREGLPLWRPFDAIAAFSLAPSLVGLAGCWLGWRSAGTADLARRWLWLGMALLGLTIVSLLVLRAGSTAHVVAMPGCALVGLRLWSWARRMASSGLRILATLSVMAALPPVAGAAMAFAIASAPDKPVAAGQAQPCVASDSLGALAIASPTILLTPLDIGPGLLQHTPHSVVATGHHRNNQVMASVIRVFTGPAGEAEALARATRAQMIVVCPGAPEWQNFRDASGEGLADILASGAVPAWMEPVPLGRGVPLQAWRIVDPSSPRAGSGAAFNRAP